MNRVVIVIPIHKENPTKNELASFVQCFKILGSHPITVLAPNGLNLHAYKVIVAEFRVTFIDPDWLSSIGKYNKLKISPYFYNLFKEYEYLLTYELDAWVFRDVLEYWCEKRYDYIGAPWFDGYGHPKKEIIGVGNSGFSLRNVPKALKILKRIQKLRALRNFWYKSKLQGLTRFEKIITSSLLPFHIKSIETLQQVIFSEKFNYNEDYFWGNDVYRLFKEYKISQVDEAIQFSMEVNPSLLFEMNNNQLPFGCHGWGKYEPEFWKNYIFAESQLRIK